MYQLQPSDNRFDHSGCEIYELYIDAKYTTLKQEILNNTYHQLNISQFVISLKKAETYITTKNSKRYKAHISNKFDVYKVYDIDADKPLTVQNILSVILYCDWSDLCNSFSKTFRKIRPYQTIESIKKSNQEYAIWSRILRETVELYGENKSDFYLDDTGKMVYPCVGPFFCGMSFVMAIPHLNIRLCSPTSTSKQIAVATRFAGNRGMIIQLQNSGDTLGKQLRAFDCSWLSNYSGENERLFFGGAYRIQIETIWNIFTGENFERYFKPLYYFHSMLNGSSMSGSNYCEFIPAEFNAIIANLIDHKLQIQGYQNKYCKYINDTFETFVSNQTQIVLDLDRIHYQFEEMEWLIMEMSGVDDVQLNPKIFQLFQNMKQLIIYSSSHNFHYAVNIIPLLSSVKSYVKNNLEIIIKANSSGKNRRSWIFREYEIIH
eukprot:495577_1